MRSELCMDKGGGNLVFLNPGDWFFGAAPAQVQTLLGSCVSVCLWHPGERVGGMCHYLLPFRSVALGHKPSGMYCDEAICLLQGAVSASGLPLKEFRCELFGGAAMFSETMKYGKPGIGEKNIAAARLALKHLGLSLFREHVGGNEHRRLSFDVANGIISVSHGNQLALPYAKEAASKASLSLIPSAHDLAVRVRSALMLPPDAGLS